jgi:hypothetical protein
MTDQMPTAQRMSCMQKPRSFGNALFLLSMTAPRF